MKYRRLLAAPKQPEMSDIHTSVLSAKVSWREEGGIERAYKWSKRPVNKSSLPKIVVRCDGNDQLTL